MKVIATKAGYFGKLRAPGDEFEVPEGAKASWFAPLNPPEKPSRGRARADDAPAE